MDYNQSRVLGLLKEIDSICKPREIHYYLAAGSMIGAIRHGGFIPWDDDADIYMKRSDWNRFVEAFNEDPVPCRVLLSPEIAPESCYTIHRYIDTSTTQLYRYHLASPQADGIMIDILILDEFPDEKEEQLSYIKSLTEYSNVLVNATSYSHKCPVKTASTSLDIEVAFLGKERVLRKYRDRLFNYPSGSCHHYVQCDAGVPHVWDKRVFEEPRYVQFENTRLPVASDVYSALVGAFDEDWMDIPDYAERETHIVTRDFCVGDSFVYKDASQFFDESKVQKNYRKRNRRVIRSAEALKTVNEDSLWFAKEYVRYCYRDVNLCELETLLKGGDYDNLQDRLEKYFRYQCSRSFIGGPSYAHWYKAHYPSYIDCGDAFLRIALKVLIHQRRMSCARKILLARLRAGGELSVGLVQVEEEIDRTKQLLSAWFRDDCNCLFEEVSEALDQYPDNPYIADLKVRLCEKCNPDDRLFVAESILGRFPDCGSAIRVKGEVQLELGDADSFLSSIVDLVLLCRDGTVLKQAFESAVSAAFDDDRLAVVKNALQLCLSGDRQKAIELCINLV